MKKIVISGSAKFETEIKKFVDCIKNKYEILDYPETIEGDFLKNYPKVNKEFLTNIEKADVFLLFNVDKGNQKGYIGSAGFGELNIALFLKRVHNKSIDVYIYQMPDKTVACYDEIMLWLNYGWIKLYKELK